MRTLSRLTFSLATLLPLVIALPARAQHEHHKGHKMDPARAAQAELGATAAFDANGNLWAAHKAEGHIAVSRSDDQGRTWSTPVRVTPAPESTDAGGDARPKIALGAGGEVYVTWTRPMSKPFTGEIRFSRSIDGGKTFLPAVTVHRDPDEITHRFDAIAVNRKGQLFIAWIDKRDLVAATQGKKDSSGYRGAAVYYAVSDDRGASFRGDFKLADHSCECCRIALAVRADDSVLAMWRHIFAPNLRDHAIAPLHPDGRAGEMRRASFDDWAVDACPHHGPSLAEDGDKRLHAIWFTAAPKNPSVFYGQLGAKGIEAQRRIGDDTAAHADLAVSGRRVAVAWKEFDGERSHLRGMISDDAGKTWRDVALTSTGGPSDQPRVLAGRNGFYVFWNTRDQPLSVTPFP